MKKYVLLIFVLLTFWGIQNVCAGQYTVNTGESINIYCTANAPSGGWITHAFYELTDGNDVQYVSLYSHSSDCYATVTGLNAKNSVKIMVTYTYSYRGAYDNKVHVGHGTYYDYVNVNGGGAATDICFNPSGLNMKVGETVKVKIKMTPEKTSSTYEWGVSMLSSAPSTYEIQQAGNELSIKAKRKMSLYLVAETNNGLIATCVIYAKDEDVDDVVSPSNISIVPGSIIIKEGETIKLDYSLKPVNASNIITWQSYDENVCKVSANGEVSALQSGQTVITAYTSNGLHASCSVNVGTYLQKVLLPSTEKVTVGYKKKLVPEISPKNAVTEWLWKSSNESVANVDDSGVVTGLKEGNATITLTSKENDVKTQCVVSVCTPVDGTDIRNVNQKILTVDKIITQALSQINNHEEKYYEKE